MYAEITFYDDDGSQKNDRPFLIPPEKIHEHIDVVDSCEMVEHEFKFTWCERIPKDQKEIDIHNIKREAYEKGYEEGREEVWKYYAGGRY